MNRRGFLGSILALGAAPAIVRADALMRVVPRSMGALTQASGMERAALEIERDFIASLEKCWSDAEVGSIERFDFYETPVTSAIITRQALMLLHGKLNFLGTFNRELVLAVRPANYVSRH